MKWSDPVLSSHFKNVSLHSCRRPCLMEIKRCDKKHRKHVVVVFQRSSPAHHIPVRYCWSCLSIRRQWDLRTGRLLQRLLQIFVLSHPDVYDSLQRKLARWTRWPDKNRRQVWATIFVHVFIADSAAHTARSHTRAWSQSVCNLYSSCICCSLTLTE